MKITQLFAQRTDKRRTDRSQPNPSQQPRRCCHQHPDGTECNANPQRGSEYCFFHNPDPAVQKKRAAARRTGGVIRSRKTLLPANLPTIRLQTVSDVAELFDETINQVRRGEMELRAATTICYLANSLVHALDVASRHERAAAQDDRASRKKHPAPLKLTVYDHTGRIIDQIPPEGPPAPLPRTDNGFHGQRPHDMPRQTGQANLPTASPDKSDPSAAPLLATGNRQLGTDLSNTPTPQPEQGLSKDPDQRGSIQDRSENALQQHGGSQHLRGSSTRACTLSQNDSQKNPSGKPDPSAPVPRTENRELRTASTTPPQETQAIQYPPGLGPRHLGPGPGGSLMAGTPLMPWWRRERLNKAT